MLCCLFSMHLSLSPFCDLLFSHLSFGFFFPQVRLVVLGQQQLQLHLGLLSASLLPATPQVSCIVVFKLNINIKFPLFVKFVVK